MKRFAIIVAGGNGSRMQSELPKQFIPVGGKPILMRTIEQFTAADKNINIILVLPKEQINYWQELQIEHAFEVPVTVSEGGPTRFYSVKNGLACITEPGLVAVHDGVRPFVSVSTILLGFQAAADFKAAIPVIDVVDSVRKVSGEASVAVNRSDYRLVQTPQVFQLELLRKAYEQDYSAVFTDDASVVEALGQSIHLYEGNRENIKLTTPFDLRLAELLLD